MPALIMLAELPVEHVAPGGTRLRLKTVRLEARGR